MTEDYKYEVIWVPVPFSAAEYRRLQSDRHLTGPGTVWAAVRTRMGMASERPVRYAAKDVRHRLVVHPDPPWERP